MILPRVVCSLDCIFSQNILFFFSPWETKNNNTGASNRYSHNFFKSVLSFFLISSSQQPHLFMPLSFLSYTPTRDTVVIKKKKDGVRRIRSAGEASKEVQQTMKLLEGMLSKKNRQRGCSIKRIFKGDARSCVLLEGRLSKIKYWTGRLTNETCKVGGMITMKRLEKKLVMRHLGGSK